MLLIKEWLHKLVFNTIHRVEDPLKVLTLILIIMFKETVLVPITNLLLKVQDLLPEVGRQKRLHPQRKIHCKLGFTQAHKINKNYNSIQLTLQIATNCNLVTPLLNNMDVAWMQQVQNKWNIKMKRQKKNHMAHMQIMKPINCYRKNKKVRPPTQEHTKELNRFSFHQNLIKCLMKQNLSLLATIMNMRNLVNLISYGYL